MKITIPQRVLSIISWRGSQVQEFQNRSPRIAYAYPGPDRFHMKNKVNIVQAARVLLGFDKIEGRKKEEKTHW